MTVEAFPSLGPLKTARASLDQVVSTTLLHSKGLITISLERRVRVTISNDTRFSNPVQEPK